MSESRPPITPLLSSFAIDGGKIKAIRESKKLTQLYIATCLGVTVDTVSRWKNGRSPNIKLENAEKLAEVLEIPLTEIENYSSSEPDFEQYEKKEILSRARKKKENLVGSHTHHSSPVFSGNESSLSF